MAFRPLAVLRKAAARLRGGPVWRGGASDIVATLYEDGVILAISPSAAQIIGAAGDLVGRSLFDFVRREDRAAVRGVLASAAERGVYARPARLTASFTLLRVRRAAAPAEITIRPLGRGRLAALIRERAPDRAAAPAAASRAEPPDARQDETSVSVDLMADLAHEMKTPLNAIMGFADAMRAETFGPLGADERGAQKYAEYVNHIHASGAHLTALIDAVRDTAKTRAGKYRLVRASVDPAELARECAAMIEGAAEAAGLALRLDIPAVLPSARLDQRAVKQILVNLLSNAVKFTEKGEIALSVSTSDRHVEFAVSDTGVGMNQVVLAKLGGRYSDTHKNGVRGTAGSGLGLSLAFELARLHGGVLDIQSAPGEGTTARLSLPRTLQALQDPAMQPADIQSQLDRVNAFRAERAGRAA